MKVKINCFNDEYQLAEVDSMYEYAYECNVPANTIKRWERIVREFYQVQREMAEAVEAVYNTQ